MSGGSLNYLCRAAKYGDLGDGEWRENIEKARERLAALPGTEDACGAILELLNAMADVTRRGEELGDLFEAIEWTISGDSSENSIARAHEQWRKERSR